MPATIQKILKPTKYRAVDTSTLEQLGPEFYNDTGLHLSGDQAESTSGTYWHTGGNITIDADGSGGGPCIVFGPDDPTSGDNIGSFLTGYNGTTSRGQGISPFGDIQQGDKFQVTYTFDGDVPTGGSIRVQFYSVSSGGNGNHNSSLHTTYSGVGAVRSGSTDGITYTEDIVVNTLRDGSAGNGTDYNNAFIFTGFGDDAASWDSGSVKIKNVSIRKYYSQANNNHGQIYSGRGLEFDGLSDRFSVPLTADVTSFTAGKPWTWACWMKFDVNNSTDLFVGNDGSSHPHLFVYADGALGFRDSTGNADYFRPSTDSIQTNTWYRVVYVASSSNTLKIYLNGQQYGNEITASTAAFNGAADYASRTFSTTAIKFTGWGGPYASGGNRGHYFPGKMSDAQIWDTAWTQSDVTYDYLNPESLALNNSGTSLTEFNLKLWYPMQDGHRGQQSYILDGANTGLGEELAINPDMNPDGPGWRFNNKWEGLTDNTLVSTTDFSTNSDESVFYTTFDNKQVMYFKCIDADPSASNEVVDQSFVVVEGVTYKFHVRVWVIQGQLRAWQSNTRFQDDIFQLSSTTGQWEDMIGYLTCDNSGNGSFNIGVTSGGSVECYIDFASAKPVNDKHHATTVFYGDEKITEENNRLFESATGVDWASYDSGGTANTTISIDSNVANKLQVTTSTEDNIEGCKLQQANFQSGGGQIVVGRTYRVSVDLQLTTPGSGTGDWTAFTIKLGGTASAEFDITYSEATYTKDIIVSDNTGSLLIYNSSSTQTIFTVDNVSIKEVGTASGWTDADQQLDIPQTALQSYNQLAWFNSENQNATEDSIGFTDGSSDLNFQATNWSASFWLYVFDDNVAGDANLGGYVMSKGEYDSSGWYIFCEAGGYLRLYTPQSGDNDFAQSSVLPKGEWNHCVATVGSSGTSAKWYINGELDSTSTIDAATSNTDNFNLMNRLAATNALGGSINEISMWNKTLTKSDVNELYNNGKALDAKTHSASSNLLHYWRNNGLAEWTDLGNATTLYNGTPNQITETLLLPAGVDASRDTQGFLMNRQKNTNSLNLKTSEGVLVNTDSSDSVIVQDSPSFDHSDGTNSKFSISAWFKAKEVGNLTTDKIIISKGTNNSSKREWKLLLDDSSTTQLLLEASSDDNGGAGNDLKYDLGDITDTNWHHIVVTYDGTAIAGNEVVAYLDGGSAIEVSDADAEAKINADDGDIDDVCIYTDILSPTEVKRNYNAGKRSHR